MCVLCESVYIGKVLSFGLISQVEPATIHGRAWDSSLPFYFWGHVLRLWTTSWRSFVSFFQFLLSNCKIDLWSRLLRFFFFGNCITPAVACRSSYLKCTASWMISSLVVHGPLKMDPELRGIEEHHSHSPPSYFLGRFCYLVDGGTWRKKHSFCYFVVV